MYIYSLLTELEQNLFRLDKRSHIKHLGEYFKVITCKRFKVLIHHLGLSFTSMIRIKFRLFRYFPILFGVALFGYSLCEKHSPNLTHSNYF